MSPEEQKKLIETLSKDAQPGSLPKSRPGSVSMSMLATGNTLQTALRASAVSMDRFASQLTFNAGRCVIDKTGITGLYDISLRYAMDPQMGGGMIRMMPSIDGGPTPAAEAPSGPTIFTALQEQLGLKLEADKAPLDYFIIDNIEKPSEN
jgi:uncharacterized protein (TIGR03435 family)